MSAKSAIGLFTKRKFLPLFVLFQAGTFNDNVLKNALISLVTFGGMVLFAEGLPREGMVAVAALLFTMPFLILCTIAGQIADKVDRGTVLKWVKRSEVVIMVIAAFGFFFESTYTLAFTLFLMGAQSAFFSPTKNAVLPQWLKDEELITANGLMSGFQFFTILVGMIVGLKIVMRGYRKGGEGELLGFDPNVLFSGPKIVAILLLIFAFLGWYAAERVPAAPAPQPDLKIDYNPITSIYGVLKTAFQHMPVLRPMLGIAWFYGFSNVMILALPVFVRDVMGYDENVLTIILVCSTLSILTGSLLCLVLARGKEAIGLVAIGILGVTLFSLDIYLNSEPTTRTGLATLNEFWVDSGTPRFLLAIIGSSLCAGLYVVPLQAMAQRRAEQAVRGRLMSAGAVLLNASVNFVTFFLIGLSFLTAKEKPEWFLEIARERNWSLPQVDPATPFLAIVIISLVVCVYVIYRMVQIRKQIKSS